MVVSGMLNGMTSDQKAKTFFLNCIVVGKATTVMRTVKKQIEFDKTVYLIPTSSHLTCISTFYSAMSR